MMRYIVVSRIKGVDEIIYECDSLEEANDRKSGFWYRHTSVYEIKEEDNG